MQTRRFLRLFVAAAAIGLLAWYALEVRDHRFHNDDAYIGYRYAEHLAQGHGLVWNVGERVEGYTNFLWVVLLGACSKLGLPLLAMSDALSILAGVALLYAAGSFLVRRRNAALPWALAAPVILVSYKSFTAWSTSGMETMLFASLLFAAYARLAHELSEREAKPWGSSLLFAAACLTRPDGLLFAGIAGLFVLEDAVRHKTAGRLLAWGLPLTAIVAIHFGWRRAYYGYWLPNTFYAKVNSSRPERGLLYLRLFHETYWTGFLLPLLLVPLFRRPRRTYLLMLTPVIAYVAYIIAIGGDTFEFRFLVTLLPFVVVLVVDGLRLVTSRLPQWLGAAVATVVVAFAAWAGQQGSTPERSDRFGHQVRSIRQLSAVAEQLADQGRELRQLIDDGLLPEDLVICHTAVGALPYYSRLETIDFHGLNDVFIARTPVANANKIAHEHEAPDEYLEERNVHMFIADYDIFRKIPKVSFQGRTAKYRERWRNVPVNGKYLSFATFVSDEEFQAKFGHLLEPNNVR